MISKINRTERGKEKNQSPEFELSLKLPSNFNGDFFFSANSNIYETIKKINGNGTNRCPNFKLFIFGIQKKNVFFI